MGAILNKTVDRAIKLNFIPSSDRDAVISKIEQLSAKYGVSGDDFAIFALNETEGLDPRADNGLGCVGIIQFCPDRKGSGVKRIGGQQVALAPLKNLSVLQQLDYVDKYFTDNNLKQGAQLADLYLTVLNPASRSIKDLDANLNIPGRQSSNLYSSAGYITRRSLEKGIRERAAKLLGGPLPPSDPAKQGGLPGDYASATGGGVSAAVGLISAVFSSNCTEPFPINFTLKESLTYAGCKNKLASAVMGQSGLGYPAQAMQVLGQAATGLGQYIQGAPVCPGCLIWPFEGRKDGKPTWPLTSPRSANRNGSPHHGVDFGCPIGTPLLAAGDGKIITSRFNAGGYGWFITIDHGNNLFTRYGHMREQGLSAGTQVKQGQVIGYSGNTGSGTGPHLHFEVRRADDYKNYNNSLEPSGYCK